MSTYNAAILISPDWDATDRARAQQLLRNKIAKETTISIDEVTRRVIFEERDDAAGRLLVATLHELPSRLVIPVGLGNGS